MLDELSYDESQLSAMNISIREICLDKKTHLSIFFLPPPPPPKRGRNKNLFDLFEFVD